MEAAEFIVQNWSPRDTAQVALKFGLLFPPVAAWVLRRGSAEP